MWLSLLNILKSIGVKNILVILSYLACLCFGYWLSSLEYSAEISRYKLDVERQKNALLLEISLKEKSSRETIAQIERDNLLEQERIKREYENTISDMRSKYVLRDSVQCSSRSTENVRAETTDTRKVRCYEEDELYRKIEQSMAIAKECDELANDYNALLEVCRVN